MLLQRVDSAIGVLTKPLEFGEEAAQLCLFVQNAEAVARALGIERLVGEVLYEVSDAGRVRPECVP